jgi:hypothetical protein
VSDASRENSSFLSGHSRDISKVAIDCLVLVHVLTIAASKIQAEIAIVFPSTIVMDSCGALEENVISRKLVQLLEARNSYRLVGSSCKYPSSGGSERVGPCEVIYF